MRAFLSTCLFLSWPVYADTGAEDPHLWLEAVTDESALTWVEERNQRSTQTIGASGDLEVLQADLLTILNSDERIPYVSKRGEYLYNFWRDGDHPQGLWRRTTRESYRTDSPDWDIILDLDALAKEEEENWVWHGATCLPPEYERCILSLSRGGADADVKREFDMPSRSFVQDGFAIPEAKGNMGWVDIDHVIVGTDFGEGSLTESGYPRIAKLWTRGTPLESAEVLFEGEVSDISAGAYHSHMPGYERTMAYRGLTFYTNQAFLWTKKGMVQLDKQDSANIRLWKDHVLIELREDWEVDGNTYRSGALLAAPLKHWLKGKKKIEVLFSPEDHTSLSRFTTTHDHLVVTTLEHVKSRIHVFTPGKKGWTRSELPGLPEFGHISVSAVDDWEGNDYWLSVRDFVTPDTISMGTIGGEVAQPIKSLPAFFNAEGLVVSQHFATSQDGTQVPYFQVAHEAAPMDGTNPTLLYGYGGFEVSLLPFYSGTVGTAWLEKGGVYVVANIRGGGEYGPRWHQAALKENRHRAYEDFAAVGEDLVARGVTSPQRLGIQGGSNGGLLMGNMYTQYPEHWGAIVCQVPLLDMKRYTKLLAGASWAGEYGDPDDPEQWKFIQTFSPYHNIDGDQEYPHADHHIYQR